MTGSEGAVAGSRRRRGRPLAVLAVSAVVALALLLVLPLVGLALRLAPSEILIRLARPEVRQALWLSVVTSSAVTLVVVGLGLPAAYVLATRQFPGKRLLEILISLPMVLPPTVSGFALLLAFGRASLGGRMLSVFGVTLPYTTLGVIVAQTFMAVPFFIGPARAGFAGVERRYLEVATTLQADEVYAFWRVVLPLSRASLLAGASMAWARALGEFGATITFAGNLPGRTQTMPLAVYLAMQDDLDRAVALSLVLVIMAVVLLLGFRHSGFDVFGATRHASR